MAASKATAQIVTSAALSAHRAFAGTPPTTAFIDSSLSPRREFARVRPSRAPDCGGDAIRMCSGCERSRCPIPDRPPHYNPAVATELSIQRRDDERGVVPALYGELDVVSGPK